jgi:hypothetical protein
MENGLIFKFLVAAKRIIHTLVFRNNKSEKRRLILVVGVQRSGTNMIMEVFSRGFQYDSFSDSDSQFFDNCEFRPTNEVIKRSSSVLAPIIALKPMMETYKLNEMLQEFPNCQGIWVYRCMADVVNSHVAQWAGMPDSLRRIKADRDWNDWRAKGISDDSYKIIGEFSDENLTNETACAIFWYVRNIQFFEKEYYKDNRVFLLPYEKFVVEPELRFSKLFVSMKLPFTPFMTKHIHKQSLSKKEEPKVNPEIRKLCKSLEDRFSDYIQEVVD